MIKQILLISIGLLTIFSCRNKIAEKQDYMAIYHKYNKVNLEEVSILLHDYTEKYPKNYNGWTFLGSVAYELDNDSIAENAYNKALKINPNNKKALTGLGAIYRIKGLYKEAKELYQKSLEIDPDFASAYSSLIIIELINDNFSKAIEYGEKAWKLDSTNAVTAANMAIANHYHSNDNLSKIFYQRAKYLNYSDTLILDLVLTNQISKDELLTK